LRTESLAGLCSGNPAEELALQGRAEGLAPCWEKRFCAVLDDEGGCETFQDC